MKLLNLANASTTFSKQFKDFHQVEAVKALFGDKTQQVLDNLKVEFSWGIGYMHVDNEDGHLIINKTYLAKGDKTDIYLDLVHELVHVKQFMDGKDLFDQNYSYVDRPTEIEAYQYTVKEAQRLGLNQKRIHDYLAAVFLSERDYQKLLHNLNFDKLV